ncbi:hypothetical protein [Candidatus Halobonum tyrrellensis]|uniref:hypothetical protein n=1 Tax=Candidatus Halobonum tyrrellensis TaxID=1431545 RepID=UPI00137814B9|nr:hypothetical protein [Candidatus Halobonum tyrrellensis]
MDGDRPDGPTRPDRSIRSDREATARASDTETPAGGRAAEATEAAVGAGGTDR